MPCNRMAFSRVSHISFSARDLMTSVSWYRPVLGLQEIDYVEGDALATGGRALLMIHEPSGTCAARTQPTRPAVWVVTSP